MAGMPLLVMHQSGMDTETTVTVSVPTTPMMAEDGHVSQRVTAQSAEGIPYQRRQQPW